MQKITKDMVIGDILRMDPEMAGVLVAGGMHCVGCPSSINESLEQACYVHGLDADAVLANINEYLAQK